MRICARRRIEPNSKTTSIAITETVLLNEEKQVSWSFSGLEDPGDAIAILKIENASLEPNSLLEISRVCNQAIFARSLNPAGENGCAHPLDFRRKHSAGACSG